ncbi:MAG: hypothetical protein ACKOCT_08240, partial [Alphaproteobacteria bacterium]
MEREQEEGADAVPQRVPEAPPLVPLPEGAAGGPQVDVHAEARRFRAASSAALQDWHLRGAGGAALVERRSDDVDRLVGFLFDAATARYR